MSERILRNKMVRFAKKAVETGLVSGTWGNISSRLGKDRFLITPSGIEKSSLRPSDLVVIDIDGKVVKGKLKPSTEMPMHLAIYNARDDVGAIFHTHSIFATVLSVLGMELPALTVEFAMVVGRSVPVVDYALPGTDDLASKVVMALGDRKKSAILGNHGVVAVGSCLEEAFLVALLVEMEAKIYCISKMLGEPRKIPDESLSKLQERYLTYGQRSFKGKI